VNVTEFMPHTDKDVGQLLQKLWTMLRSGGNPHLKALAEAYRMDMRFCEALAACPAGVRLHHAYVGGLLEHTVTMMEIGEKLLLFYPGTDRDLLLMGTFLHDLGKVRELSFKRTYGYTDEGQLLGHIHLGTEMLAEKALQAAELTGEPFPRELLLRLKHMILSHHGTLEHGSPKIPMTPEAMLLHEIDSLDTRMHMALRDIRDDAKNQTAWTPWNPTLSRRFFKGGPNGDLFGEVRELFD
jgi:3'-5' exoribonuclease